MDTYRALADRFDRWARVCLIHGNAIREPGGDAKGPSSNRKNEYFRRRAVRREYLIFSRGRETRTGTTGPFVLRIDRPAPAIDIFEVDPTSDVFPTDGTRETPTKQEIGVV